MYYNSELSILNNEQFYYPGIEAVESALEISKNINISIDQPYNIFVYWIGDNVNYKHSLVIKSFLVTQSLKNATLKIYSDKDISNSEWFLRYKNFPQVEFHIFNVYNETANTKFSNFAYKDQIHNHSFNPAYESDFFRLLMLHKHGGIYIDFDVLILRDLSPLINYNFLYQWGAFPNNMINGAIMHLIKDSNANRTMTDLLLSTPANPGQGNLSWASDLYVKAKQLCSDLIIFPAAFFNTEWQSEQTYSGLLEPLKAHLYSTSNYDGCFTWHWHNRWDEPIEINSKFDLLDKKLEQHFKTKFLI